MVEARFTKKIGGAGVSFYIGHAFFPALMNLRGISS